MIGDLGLRISDFNKETFDFRFQIWNFGLKRQSKETECIVNG